jgi:mannose-6-phosphate isomerase-like protein (cupin superfamily)
MGRDAPDAQRGDPMDNYDIRYDDKYGQLTHIDLAAEGAAHDPWFNQTLTTVSDCVVRLAVIEGRLVDWHKHEHEDEFFLVLEGRLELEVEGREPFVLGPRQGVTIPRGIVHRPHALGRTVVLMVEPATVVPTGND